jgi:signal transduction histidine kinase
LTSPVITEAEPSPRTLAEASIAAREEEARRIARELHDDAGQLFAWAFLALDDVSHHLAPDGAPRLEEVKSHLRALEARLAHLAQELRPRVLDELGLVPALQFLAESVAERTGMPVAVAADAVPRLAPDVEIAAYRIVQEGLTNVTKHARARAACVGVSLGGDTLAVSVRDDGVGLPSGGPPERGLGLLGVRERLAAHGGRLTVTSSPGGGTQLHAEIPLPCPAASR